MQRFVVALLAFVIMTGVTFADDVDSTEAEKNQDTLRCDDGIPFVLNTGIDASLTKKIFETVVPCLRLGKPQEIVINSGGGEAWTSFGIYDALRAADKNKVLTTHVYGHGHSGAVIVFLAGATRQVGCHSSMLLHKVKRSGYTSTNDPEQIRYGADRLEQTTQNYAKIVAQATGILSQDEVIDLMDEEKHRNPSELLNWRIATEVIGC